MKLFCVAVAEAWKFCRGDCFSVSLVYWLLVFHFCLHQNSVFIYLFIYLFNYLFYFAEVGNFHWHFSGMFSSANSIFIHLWFFLCVIYSSATMINNKWFYFNEGDETVLIFTSIVNSCSNLCSFQFLDYILEKFWRMFGCVGQQTVPSGTTWWLSIKTQCF